MITKRWIDGPTATPEEWDKIESILAARGWMSLSRELCRILVAEDESGALKGFSVLQVVPQAGPLYVVPSERGTGLAAILADETLDWLVENKARGWLVIAENSFTEKLVEERGMVRLKSPVYVTG